MASLWDAGRPPVRFMEESACFLVVRPWGCWPLRGGGDRETIYSISGSITCSERTSVHNGPYYTHLMFPPATTHAKETASCTRIGFC